MTKYAYSTNEENYHSSYDTIEEAVTCCCEENSDIEVGQTVHVGEIHSFTIYELLPNYDFMFEQIEEAAYEEVSDICDGRFGKNLSEIEEAMVMKEIGDVFLKHGVKPEFFKVENVIGVKVEAKHKDENL